MRKSVDPKPQVEAVVTYIDALNQQLDNTRLLGREQLIPRWVAIL